MFFICALCALSNYDGVINLALNHIAFIFLLHVTDKFIYSILK